MASSQAMLRVNFKPSASYSISDISPRFPFYTCSAYSALRASEVSTVTWKLTSCSLCARFYSLCYMRNTSNTQLHFTVFPLECSDKSRSVTCALTSLCLHKSRSDVYLICETTHSQIKKYNKFGSHIGQSPESLLIFS